MDNYRWVATEIVWAYILVDLNLFIHGRRKPKNLQAIFYVENQKVMDFIELYFVDKKNLQFGYFWHFFLWIFDPQNVINLND